MSVDSLTQPSRSGDGIHSFPDRGAVLFEGRLPSRWEASGPLAGGRMLETMRAGACVETQLDMLRHNLAARADPPRGLRADRVTTCRGSPCIAAANARPTAAVRRHRSCSLPARGRPRLACIIPRRPGLVT